MPTFLWFWFLIAAPPTPTPAQEMKIVALVADLGSPRFKVRDAAVRSLGEMGSVAKVACRAAMQSKDEEVVTRAKIAFDKIVDAEARSLWPLPEIDAIWYCPVKKWYAYKPELHKHCHSILMAVGPDARPWHNYRWAMDRYVRELLRNGATPEGLRFWIAIWHYNDSVFFENCSVVEDEVDPPIPVDWQEYLKKK